MKRIITVNDLYIAKEALSKLSSIKGYSNPTLINLVKNIKVINFLIITWDNAKINILEECVERDEQNIPIQVNGKWSIKDEVTYYNKIRSILDNKIEMNIQPMSLEDINLNGILTADILLSIDFLIKDFDD